MKQEKKPFNLRLLLLLGTVILLLLLQIAALLPGVTTPFERIEYSVRDMLMRLRGTQEPSRDIVIVAIDDWRSCARWIHSEFYALCITSHRTEAIVVS